MSQLLICLSWRFPQLWWHPSHISPTYHVPILYVLCTYIPFWLSQTLVEPMLWCCQQISLPNKAAKRKVRGSTCICTYIHTYVFAFVCMCMIVLSNWLQIAWLCPTSDTQFTFATMMVLAQHSTLLHYQLNHIQYIRMFGTFLCTYVCTLQYASALFSVYILTVCTVCMCGIVHVYMCIHYCVWYSAYT